MTKKKHYDVVAAVVYHAGEILCMQRGKGKNPATDYRWEFPGGKIEVGETPEEALRRELREEMDYTVQPLRRLAKEDYEYPDFSITLDAWLCLSATRSFHRKEHIAHCWLRPDDLLRLDFAPADVKVIKAMRRNGTFPEEFAEKKG